MSVEIDPTIIPGCGARIWTTRDGAKMKWADMTPRHLRNSAALVERSFAEEKRSAWSVYATVRSEAAELAIESAISHLEYNEPHLQRFVAEMRAYADWREARS